MSLGRKTVRKPVRAFRHAIGLTEAELAAGFKVDQSNVATIERE
jgi:transcriptional regulator with XRE-family HTH domain